MEFINIMEKKLILKLLFTSSLLISCSTDKKDPEELINETPTAIDVPSSYDIASYKDRGWKENIIERLFKEAIDKNNEVTIVNESIEIAAKIYEDSLKEYTKFVNINEDYWKTANSYISNISDTVVRHSIKEVFDKAELNYCNSKKELINLRDKITLEKERYDNQVLLLKLVVTLPMIQNYQKNELPDSSKLNDILTGFNNADNKINEFIKE